MLVSGSVFIPLKSSVASECLDIAGSDSKKIPNLNPGMFTPNTSKIQNFTKGFPNQKQVGDQVPEKGM